MSIDANLKMVKGVMDAFLGGDVGPLLGALTEDATTKAVIAEGTPISGDGFVGRDGFMRYLTALGEVMEIVEVVTDDYAASENSVVILGRERARVRRTGGLLDCEIATIFTLRGGKIARMVAMADMSPIVAAYRDDVGSSAD